MYAINYAGIQGSLIGRFNLIYANLCRFTLVCANLGRI